MLDRYPPVAHEFRASGASIGRAMVTIPTRQSLDPVDGRCVW